MRRATNRDRLGVFNEAVILDAIRRAANGVSRVELAAQTGLSAQAISKIVRRLLDNNMVSEGGKTIHGPGKPRTVLQLDPTSRYAIGVHLDPASINLVMLDLFGQPVGRSRVAMPRTPTPEQAINTITTAIGALVDSSGLDAHRILGVGLASPGPIDSAAGVVVGPSLLRGWEAVPLRTALHKATKLPVLLDKDATAAAVAESWSGDHEGHHSFAVFYLGTGVGLGLVLDNEVVRGDFHNAGEIGHLYSGQDTPVHSCGRRGCLGSLLDPLNLIRKAMEAGVLDRAGEPTDLIRVQQLYDTIGQLARGGEPRASAIVHSVAQGLGRVIVDIANMLDLDRVVLGGPFWPAIAEPVLSDMRSGATDKLTAAAIHAVEVRGSSMGGEVGAIGAACLILDHVFSPKAKALVFEGEPVGETT